MIYKNFKIKNFKGIDESEINLENNRIITLVGLNESGKTTIMEAIALFYRMIKGTEPNFNELNEFRPKGIAFTGNIEIEGTLIFEDEDTSKIETFWKKELKEKNKLEFPKEFSYTFKFNFKLHTYKETERVCSFNIKKLNNKKKLYDSNKKAWQKLINFIKKDLVPEILYYDDFIFQIPNKICFVKGGISEDQEITNKDNEIWMSVIDDILKSVDSRMSFQEQVVDIWDTDEDAASNRLAQMEKVLDEKITSRWSELFGSNKLKFRNLPHR